MTAEEERPSIAERYVACATSSHLKVEGGPCDADMLIAAGRISAAGIDPLGLLLWRLRGEFDAVRAELRPEGELNITERFLVLAELRSLHPAKQRLWETVSEWLRTSWLGGDEMPMLRDEAMAVTGRVLDAWLDPNCPTCEGRGFSGGTHRGEQRLRCRGCSGTGLRRTSIARDGRQRLLADRLQFHIDGLLFTTAAEMSIRLRTHFAESA